jgi:lyso-ornithine lipid O-acyltransferase
LLKSGQSVLVYPEGTTAAVGTTLPFKIGTFAIAAEENIPIVPIALEYADSSAAFVDDDLFLPHFLRVFSKKYTFIKIHFFEPIENDTAENLAKKTQELIDNQLIVWQKT